jgi:hypothetical protein
MNKRKITLVRVAAIGCIILLTTTIYLVKENPMHEESRPDEHALDITIKNADNSKFIRMLKNFSNIHHFTMTVGERSPQGKSLMIEINGPGILILSNNISDGNIFYTGSYTENAPKYGKDATRDIMTELAAYARTVPGIEVTVNY